MQEEEKIEETKTEETDTANLHTEEKEEKTEKVETTAETPEQKKETESLLNKWLPPAVGYGAFFGALALAVGIGLLVCLL